MPVVVGIRFKDSGKTYFFDPSAVETLDQGDSVIVETVRGLELAKVARAPHSVADTEVIGELKPVIRRAEAADFERMRLLGARHDEVLARCSEKIQEHSLPMRLVKAEYSFDGSRLTFYFTSEKRVDFRVLVRDLARTFKTRIELRQVGPRDEAKLLGGIGPCGRMLCCSTFLPDYARVSIKMAKDQDLPLNPTKISGVCGRLLCCLSYEHEQYLEIKAELPKRGAWVQTPDGPGEVVAVNVVRETNTPASAGCCAMRSTTPMCSMRWRCWKRASTSVERRLNSADLCRHGPRNPDTGMGVPKRRPAGWKEAR
jgi:cell fate regulator YaaT (PSP1 superfamily)